MKVKFLDNYYDVIIEDNIITAKSNYAKKPFFGVAKCAPEDTFDKNFGVSLAVRRCAEKIELARYKFERSRLDAAMPDYYRAAHKVSKIADIVDETAIRINQLNLDAVRLMNPEKEPNMLIEIVEE